jgi:hypothetical protein
MSNEKYHIDPLDDDARLSDNLMKVNRKLRNRIVAKNRQINNAERLIDNAEMRIDIMTGMLNPAEYEKSRRKIIKPDFRYKNEAVAISLLSDIHAEEEIEPASCNYWNKSNPAITEMKLNNYREGVLKTTRELRKTIAIPHLTLGWLGDLISGYIHEELMELN